MSEQIKVNDLVMVVRNNGCCTTETLGMIGTVREIKGPYRSLVCSTCETVIATNGRFYSAILSNGKRIEISRLRKFGAPTESIAVVDEEELQE